jgi:cellulose synthase operon protein YhjQ
LSWGASLGADTKRDSKEIASPSGHSSQETRDGVVDPPEKPQDDLTELLARAAMLQSQYREFEAAPRAPKDAPLAPNPPNAKKETPRDPGTPAVQGPVRWRRPAAPELQPIPRNTDRGASAAGTEINAGDRSASESDAQQGSPKNSHAEGKPSHFRHLNESVRRGQKQFNSGASSRWSVLGQIFSGEGDATGDHLVQALATSIKIPFQFVCSVSGGAGVSMILATLARCLATEGENVLLADPKASSLLPIYFGASNPGEGELQSFLMPNSDAGVSIVNSLQGSEGAFSRRIPKESRSGLIATVRNAAEHSDRLLLDAGAVYAADVQSLRHRGHFGLVPLVPDVGSVYGLIRLEETLQSRELEGSPASPIYYVLNKFDSSLALHRDIKSSLEERVRERLVPVTIRSSDAVSEALADGMTVIDYCPDSGVAEDFLRLADWLRHMAPIGQPDLDESR